MKSAVPVFTGTGRARANSILSCDKKSLRTILETVHLQGFISELTIFEIFVNRKDAFTFIQRGTTGRNRLLDSYLTGGVRYYRFSQHFLAKNAEMEKSL
jgi:hypothetical protein